jgi:glycosyltransferase involved in cell wall biosynthesis
MPIKVLVISNYRSQHTARPEAAIFFGLAKLGFDIHVMTYGDSSFVPDFKAAGMTVVDFHPKRKFDRAESDFIRKYVVENKIDIMHLFNSPATINGIRAAKGLTVKVVLYRGYTGNIHWWDPTAYFKYLNPRVDAIFCNSIGVKQLLDRQLFFKKKKAVTINKGHDLSWYQYEPYDIRSELGISKDALLLVTVANNRRMKGVPYLLKAMSKLPKGLDIHLLLIGRDMDTKQNIRLLEKGAYKDNVHFLGFRRDVLNIEASCDLFVLPSITGESITKSVIEAMSLGVGAIISDIPGNVELVEEGVNGLVFPSKNVSALSEAMLKVYNNRPLVEQFGQASKERVATVLSNEQTVIKTKKLYEDLMNGVI